MGVEIPNTGVVRLSFVHYTQPEEIDQADTGLRMATYSQ